MNTSPLPPPPSPTNTTLLIGCTGLTGLSALNGILNYIPPQNLLLLSSRPSEAARNPALSSTTIAAGNLDDPSSLQPVIANNNISSIYIHALSKDAANADPLEFSRAENLLSILQTNNFKGRIIFNGSAGRGRNAGISQMDQKQLIADKFATTFPSTFISLEAVLFMEEFWKKYTRPAVLHKGTFSFAVPADKKLQLLSVRDMGRATGQIITNDDVFSKIMNRYNNTDGDKMRRNNYLSLAGDELTPVEMAKTFSRVQQEGGVHVVFKRLPSWPFWLINRNLYRIIRFLSTQGYDADVAWCRETFGGMEGFEEFLVNSGWRDERLEWVNYVRGEEETVV
jgi:hypothetical protein